MKINLKAMHINIDDLKNIYFLISFNLLNILIVAIYQNLFFLRLSYR